MSLTIELKDESEENISISTTRRMTPEEFTALISKRAIMLAKGEKCVLPDIDGCYDVITLAKREILEYPSKIPLVIVRNFRDGTKEYCLIEDMEIRDH